MRTLLRWLRRSRGTRARSTDVRPEQEAGDTSGQARPPGTPIWPPAVIAGLAFAFYVCAFGRLYADFFADSFIFHQRTVRIASQFAATGHFAYAEGDPAFYPMWGYPFLVAMLDLRTGAADYLGTKVLQAALLGLATGLLYLMLRRDGIGWAWSSIVTLIFCVSPTVSGFVGSTYDQHIMPPLVGIAFFLVWRYFSATQPTAVPWSLLSAGLVLGLASNIRSECLFLPLFLLVVLGIPSRQWRVVRDLALMTAVFFLCLLPWTVRSYLASGRFLLSSANAGAVMYISLGQSTQPNIWGVTHIDACANERLAELRPDLRVDVFNSPQASALLMSDVLTKIRQHPAYYLTMLHQKFQKALIYEIEACHANKLKYDIPLIETILRESCTLFLLGRLASLLVLASLCIRYCLRKHIRIGGVAVAAAFVTYVIILQSVGQCLGRHLTLVSLPSYYLSLHVVRGVYRSLGQLDQHTA